MQYLIDYSIPKNDVYSVFKIIGVMVLLIITQLFLGILTAKTSSKIAMQTSASLRYKIFKKVQGLSQEEIDNFTISSLITRTCTDVQHIQMFLSMSLTIIFIAPLMCIIGIVKAINVSPELSSILTFSIPTLLIFLIAIGKITIPLTKKIQKKLDDINRVIKEQLTGSRIIRAFGTKKFEKERFEKVNFRFFSLNKKMMYLLALYPSIVNTILAITTCGIILFAILLITDENLVFTAGQVVAIISYVLTIITSVIFLAIIFLFLPRTITCATRTKEVLESINLIKDAQNFDLSEIKKQGFIEFKKVSFTYAVSSKPAISNLSFKTGPGQTTAIIGGTGMGKSTIINMIPRLYDCTEGEILVDGLNVKDYKISELRKKIGFVPQKANLFKGTIYSNIEFGCKNASEEQVIEALKISQSYDFVKEKEKGIYEPVAQMGTNFSGGQKQRLCIARAIASKREIYIFDDSFSALDFKTDKTLRKALKSKTKNAATIIVAQRVNTIIDADQIIVVDKGKVVGIGKHNELIKNCEIYNEIVRSQIGTKEAA